MLNLGVRRIRRSRRDERGLALSLMALVLVAMLGVAGLVVDLGSWQVEASRVQQAADAAALAGVVLLPDGDAAAIARAREVAAANGFDDTDADVDVVVTPLPNESIEVTVTKREVPQYLTQAVRGDDPPTITRRATAQYIQPVPLGSPRNFLGTNGLNAAYAGLSGTNAVENYYLAISGVCTRREFGDRIATRAMNNSSVGNGCTVGVNNTKANPEFDSTPEFDSRGYLFGVTVPETNGGAPVGIQMYDAPMCPAAREPARNVEFSLEAGTVIPYEVTVRRLDNLDPYLGTVESSRTFTGNSTNLTGVCRAGSVDDGECSPLLGDRLRQCWVTLATVSDAGDYTIQVNPVEVNTPTNHNLFSLRATRNGTFTPCTSDSAVGNAGNPATPAYDASCPQVFATEHVPVAARGTGTPVFFLADIDSQHNNKTMQVTLYDAAEGASQIELLAPDGQPADFTWEVLCSDGSQADGGGNCPDPDELGPSGGRSSGATPVDFIDVAGSGDRTFPQNTQSGKYSDRLLRLTVKLPANIDTAYGGNTWWKIRYTGGPGGFTGDRTTWSVQLLGDPVRLIPNN